MHVMNCSDVGASEKLTQKRASLYCEHEMQYRMKTFFMTLSPTTEHGIYPSVMFTYSRDEPELMFQRPNSPMNEKNLYRPCAFVT